MATAYQYDPSKFASEYTPEINADYEESLARKIRERGAANVATAKGDALRRGMAGDPYEALRVGTAEANTANALGDLSSGLAYKKAGLQREERMGAENFQRTTEYQSAEAEKQRAWQQQMQAIQQQYNIELAKMNRKWQKQDYWSNLAGDVIGTATGYGLGALVF